ncbi:MAG TPA: glycosyltransferase, partial [Candidatus Gracilibacteria bacterium]
MIKRTFILDQGEFFGGAEAFTLDFLGSLNGAEIRKINPIIVGARSEVYKERLHKANDNIPIEPFDYPSVRGNKIQKMLHTGALALAGKRLKKMAEKYDGSHQFITNTPRTHFVMYLAKKLWRIKGKWLMMIHDFTTPTRLMKAMASQSDVVIANSMPTRNHLHGILRERDKKKIKIVENGIDIRSLPKPRPVENIQQILMLGRIDPRKGQKFALEAADLLLERNPDLHFSIVGSPVYTDQRTVDYQKEIKTFARDRDLTNVTFEEEVPNALERINQADLVLMLQTEPETFGRVAIEALALGKMVLTFDETGPKEILESFLQHLGKSNIKIPRSNFIVEAGNPMSLAECIGAWADEPQKAQALWA